MNIVKRSSGIVGRLHLPTYNGMNGTITKSVLLNNINYKHQYQGNYRHYSNTSSNQNDYKQKEKSNGDINGINYFAIGALASLFVIPKSIALCECFEEHQDHIVQIKTGYQFPKILNKSLDLNYKIVAIGTRLLGIFKFNVYSLAVYINDDEAKLTLTEHVKTTQDEFVKSKKVILQKLLEKDVGVSIKIKPTRKVTWDHIYNGLEKSISNMMWKKYQIELDEIEKQLSEFKSAFAANMEIPTTSEIDFVRKGDKLVLIFDQKVVKEIQNKKFTDTLFEFYLGERTKVPEVQKEFYNRLWKLLQPKENDTVSRFGLH